MKATVKKKFNEALRQLLTERGFESVDELSTKEMLILLGYWRPGTGGYGEESGNISDGLQLTRTNVFDNPINLGLEALELMTNFDLDLLAGALGITVETFRQLLGEAILDETGTKLISVPINGLDLGGVPLADVPTQIWDERVLNVDGNEYTFDIGSYPSGKIQIVPPRSDERLQFSFRSEGGNTGDYNTIAQLLLLDGKGRLYIAIRGDGFEYLVFDDYNSNETILAVQPTGNWWTFIFTRPTDERNSQYQVDIYTEQDGMVDLSFMDWIDYHEQRPGSEDRHFISVAARSWDGHVMLSDGVPPVMEQYILNGVDDPDITNVQAWSHGIGYSIEASRRLVHGATSAVDSVNLPDRFTLYPALFAKGIETAQLLYLFTTEAGKDDAPRIVAKMIEGMDIPATAPIGTRYLIVELQCQTFSPEYMDINVDALHFPLPEVMTEGSVILVSATFIELVVDGDNEFEVVSQTYKDFDDFTGLDVEDFENAVLDLVREVYPEAEDLEDAGQWLDDNPGNGNLDDYYMKFTMSIYEKMVVSPAGPNIYIHFDKNMGDHGTFGFGYDRLEEFPLLTCELDGPLVIETVSVGVGYDSDQLSVEDNDRYEIGYFEDDSEMRFVERNILLLGQAGSGGGSSSSSGAGPEVPDDLHKWVVFGVDGEVTIGGETYQTRDLFPKTPNEPVEP